MRKTNDHFHEFHVLSSGAGTREHCYTRVNEILVQLILYIGYIAGPEHLRTSAAAHDISCDRSEAANAASSLSTQQVHVQRRTSNSYSELRADNAPCQF
jgi:hypothetical protein